jgi:hypothetical protein
LGRPGDTTACPHRFPVVARPLDRGVTANDLGIAATTPDRGIATTVRLDQGAVATAATGQRFAATCALEELPSSHASGWVPSLMNQDGA